MENVDVIIIGAGAAGLMCAIEAGRRGRRVLVLEKSNKPGKKILMSGGGRCNFTNIHTHSDCYLSKNKHFCKSALSRYTPNMFTDLVEKHCVAYYEKTLGQLFCEDKSAQIVELLLKECRQAKVELKLNQTIQSIQSHDRFNIQCIDQTYHCQSLVIATGGLSIPTLGSSPFGYQIAKQFGLTVHPTRAGLVPFTLHTHDKARYADLSGISVDCVVSCHQKSFRENLLFTHRGLSGPAMLQISSYWHAGDALIIRLLPDIDLYQALLRARAQNGDIFIKTFLAQHLAKRLLPAFIPSALLDKPLKQFTHHELQTISDILQHWCIKPNGTEGYRTAEVTIGGIDCDELSSQTFETKKVPGLYFVGEVLDVSGWLGGYNFQWAWASGYAAGQVV